MLELILSILEDQKKDENLLLIKNLLVFRPEGTPFEDGKSFLLCVFVSVKWAFLSREVERQCTDLNHFVLVVGQVKIKFPRIYSLRGTFCPISAWSHSLTVPRVICDICSKPGWQGVC